MSKKDRLQALEITTKLISKGVSLSASFGRESYSSQTKALCFGVARNYFKLTLVAEKLLKKRPKSDEVYAAILLGLFQIQESNAPNYAVVKETVGLMDRLKKSWAKGLINGVLRTYLRDNKAIESSLSQQASYQWNHPEWLIEKIKVSWPNEWQSILQQNDKHPPLSLRVNCQKETRGNYLQRLQTKNVPAQKHDYAQEGIELLHPSDVNELPGFSKGEVSVQDQAAQLAAKLLDLKPGQNVLDACCAPGGKTCHILETEPKLANLTAIDVDAKRLQRVQDNLDRLHLSANLLEADGLKPNAWWNKKPYDRILLDAPCSATGVIRRHPDIKCLRSSKDIQQIVKLQQALLNALWPLLSENGLMVYATCSIMPEENEQQIAQFLSTHSDCKLIEHQHDWGLATGHGWQILPGTNNMDGFFYSVLCKKD